MTEKIVYSVYNLARLLSLAQLIKDHYAEKFPTNPLMLALISKLDAAIAVAAKAVKSSTKSTLTKEVQQADLDRDDSYISFRNHVKSGLRRKNEAYRTACEAIWVLLEKNGTSLYKLSNDEETGVITSLMNDLNTDEIKAHLETVHATEWLAELGRDNATFISKRKERADTRSEDDTQLDEEAFLQLRAMLDLAGSTLDTMLTLDNVEGLEAAIESSNQYIREANAAARQSDAAGKSTDEPGS